MLATVNRLERLLAELIRRFDDGGIWFVDLPHSGARYEIFNLHLTTPLLSLWENKNKSQIFNCRYSEHLSVYFLTEWLKSGFLVKVLCSKRS
jgi:SpoVK/Ycf46/Vps4 family AAA+-type ATPase